MSGFLSTLGFGQQPGPNQEFQEAMLEKVQPQLVQKSKKPSRLGPTLLSGVSGLILDSSTFEVTKTAAKRVIEIVIPMATTAQEPIAQPVQEVLSSSTLPGMESVSHGVNFVYTGASELFSFAKSTAGLGLWAFKLLPNGVQFGIGCLGLYVAYTWWRQGSAQKQEVTVNININGASSSPTVQQNGQEVQVTLPHAVTPEKPSAKQRWQEAVKTIRESKVQNKELSVEEKKILTLDRWVSAVREVQHRIEAAAKLHKTLRKYKEEQSTLLSPHLEKINALLERFQKIEDKKYAEPDVLPLVTDSRTIIKEIRKTIETKQKTIISAMKA